MADELELGDWIIRIMTKKDMTITVYPPGRLLFIDTYVRDLESGKKRYPFHFEVPKHGKTMRWEGFPSGGKIVLTEPRINCTVQIIEMESLWPPPQPRARTAR